MGDLVAVAVVQDARGGLRSEVGGVIFSPRDTSLPSQTHPLISRTAVT